MGFKKNKLPVFIAAINPDTAPIDIIPSTPKFKIPDFSVMSSPNAAINNNVAACNVAFNKPMNCISTILYLFFNLVREKELCD